MAPFISGNVLKSMSAFIYRLKKKKIVRLTEEFTTHQWIPREELLAECDELTVKLLHHAYQHVPYYKDIINKQGLDLENFQFPEDWQHLPMLGKRELRDHFEYLKSDTASAHNSYLNHSGGSTGSPVSFLTDCVQARRMTAWLNLVYSWAGWQHGEIRLELWGNKEQRIPLTFWDRVRSSVSGHYVLPVFEYSESTMQQWLLVIEQLKPTIIYGYPSVLSDFAKWIESENRQVFGLKGVFSSAEVLYPEQRNILERIFNCKVYNQYGSRETPCIACECPAGSMHIFVDFNRIEFIGSEDNAESKEIIVTPLYNYAQPLIRYQLGDMGRPLETSCPCGRGYPLMELNVARSRDVIIGPNGRSFYPGFFTRLMEGKGGISSFQFVQKKIDRIELNIELSGINDVVGCREELTGEIVPFLTEKMGNIQFTVNAVKKIDRTSVGKHRYVISEIKKGANLN